MPFPLLRNHKVPVLMRLFVRLLLLPALALLLAPAAQAQVVWQTDVRGEASETLLMRPDGSLVEVRIGPQADNITFNDVHVTAFSAQGDSLWGYQLSGTTVASGTQDSPETAVVGSDGSVYVGGQLNIVESDETGADRFAEQGFVVKLSPDGQEEWRFLFGRDGQFPDAVHEIALGPDGDVFVAASAGQPNDEGGVAGFERHPAAFRLSSNDGSVVWRVDYEPDDQGQFWEYRGMTLASDGTMILLGQVIAYKFSFIELMAPLVMTIDANGTLETTDLLFTDDDQSGLLSYQPDGFASDDGTLYSLTKRSDLQTEEQSLFLSRYDSSGERILDAPLFPDSTWKMLTHSSQVEVAPNGSVWIAAAVDAGATNSSGFPIIERMLVEYANGSARLADRARVSGDNVTDLAVDADGFVWMSYKALDEDGRPIDSQRIEQFSPAGQKLWHYDLRDDNGGGQTTDDWRVRSGNDQLVSLLPAGSERIYVAYPHRNPSGGAQGDRVGVLLLDPAQGTSAETWSEVSRLALYAPYPNPTTQRAVLRFELAASAHVTLTAYDLLGRRVALLADETLASGPHARTLDTSALAPGTYALRLSDGASSHTKMLTVVR